ncbi:TIGR04255 family protein [Serratia sarumanii]|uniref:TIGR04255 family protein n=1 Tax=Serratia sarumanii TaxID=3020826 RepID=UPI003F813C23
MNYQYEKGGDVSNAVMSDAPVYYALAQAKFNPIAAIAKYVGDIQDIFRKKGFTVFEIHEGTQLHFDFAPGEEAPKPRIANIINWQIIKSDRTCGYILNDSSITFHTTHYVTHNEFLKGLTEGIEVVNEVVGLEHLSRLGLRYLDAVLPNDQETPNDYLVNELHGVSLGERQLQTVNESVYETAVTPIIRHGMLVTRIHKVYAELGFPPDLSLAGLVMKERFKTQKTVQHAIIDTDHYVEGNIKINIEAISEQLESLYKEIKKSFNAMVTDHAKKAWQ